MIDILCRCTTSVQSMRKQSDDTNSGVVILSYVYGIEIYAIRNVPLPQ